MASLNYLWSRRARFTPGSKEFYRAWGKRMYSLPELLRWNWRRAKLVRKGARIHKSAEIGEARVDGHKTLLSIGPLSFLGQVYIALHEEVIIGERVCINDGVRLLTASHGVSDPKWNHTKGKILIEDYAWIGMGAMLLPGVHIGRGAIVGAGAVVSKSVNPGAIVIGNPAQPVEKTRCEELDYDPCEFLATNRAWLVG